MINSRIYLFGVVIVVLSLSLILLNNQVGSPTGAASGPEFGSSATISPASCAALKVAVEADCSANYELQVDIDCTGELGLTPICAAGYSGTFDGENHTITRLTINQPATQYVGLFARLNGANVTNLGLINVNITGSSYVGGLAGYTDLSSINSTYSIGNVSAVGYVGGLIGNTYRSSVINSYSISNVSSTGAVAGGLIGYHRDSSIINCFAAGRVSGNYQIGGLVGFTALSAQINNSYSSSLIIGGKSQLGGFIGSNSGASTYDNCAWFVDSCFPAIGQDSAVSDEVANITYNETDQSAFYDISHTIYSSWSFPPWDNFCDDTGYPSLDWQGLSDTADCKTSLPLLSCPSSLSGSGTLADPCIITTCAQLLLINDEPRVNYALGNDIDCSATVGWDGGDGFDPINPFIGSFDGRNFTITGLFINRPATGDVGLFGMTCCAELSNVGLLDINITGDDDVGALVGYSRRTTSVDNSYSTGILSGGGGWGEGGLIGYNYQGSTVDNCYSSVDVSGDYAGGLVGINIDDWTGSGELSSIINNSYATGNVSGDYVGGLTGYQYGSKVDNSYATGNVSGSSYIGGLVGYNYQYSTIDNSYSTGSVSGSSYTGGLVGYQAASSSVDNSYWLNQSGDNATQCVTADSGTTVCTIETTESTFFDVSNPPMDVWNFTFIWCDIFDLTDYPILQWQNDSCGGSSTSCGDGTCNSAETCSSCSEDCGNCGGCSNDWVCGNWGGCINGTQSRTCNCDCANDNDCEGDSSITQDCGCSSESNCDDGNECTQDVCLNFECSYNDLSGIECDDGDNCTDDDMCRSGICFGNVDSDCYENEDKVDDSGGSDDKECLQEWDCGQWTDCANGIQSRTCVCECDDNDCYGNSITSQECDMEEDKEGTELDVGSIEEDTEGLGTESDQNGLSGSPLENPTNWLLIIILLVVLIFLIVWKKKKQKKEEKL